MDYLSRLPDEILERIFHYVDGKQLARCSALCRRLQTITTLERQWKWLCGRDWNIFELSMDCATWKECYIGMYTRYGLYVTCYSRVERCWERIFAVTRSRCPTVYNSLLRDGATEERLALLQKSLGDRTQPIPLEFRCSYRLCNGQRVAATAQLAFPGLFGSYDEEDSGDYLCSLSSDLPHPIEHWQANRYIVRNCCLSFICVVQHDFPSMATHGSLGLCIRDESASCGHQDEHQRLDGCVVSFRSLSPYGFEYFIYHNSFIEFLEDFANRIAHFPVINNRLLKYDFNSEEDTGPYTVTVRTAFYRERSIAFPADSRQFHFFYRITMSMKPDAPACDSCQLESRHWTITNGAGEVETVDGPGVVGNYPVMRPGAQFSWVSRTSYRTSSGIMSGYFSMRKLGTGSEVLIKCPEYKMVGPEFMKVECRFHGQ